MSMDPAPIRDNLIEPRTNEIRSTSWRTWFSKLVEQVPPLNPGDVSKFLRGDDTWAVPTGVAPGPHGSSHQDGGSDEIATATPAANAIPKADGTGDLDIGWIDQSTITALGTIVTGIWNGTALTSAYVPNHDNLNGFVADEHIDWTSASDNLITTGRLTASELAIDTDTLVANLPSYTDKVGIKTATPAETLDVVGSARFGASSNYAKFDSDGDLAFTGTANYLIASNQYVFRYSADENYGLYFNTTVGSYDFTGSAGTNILRISTTDGSLICNGTGEFVGNLGVNVGPISGSSIYSSRSSSDDTGPQHGLEAILTMTVASAQDISAGQTVVYSEHSSGTIAEMKGYYGGAVVNSGSAVSGAYGLFGAAFGGASQTASVTVLSGVVSYVDAEDLSVTYGIGFYGQAPVVNGGSMSNAMTLYCAEPTGGSNNWSALFDGDIQVNSEKKLVLEGALGTKGDSYLTFDSTNNWIEIWAQNHESLRIDAAGIDVNGPIRFQELSADPTTPAEGEAVMWMSDGTGSGDDGDIMIKIQAGATTKTVTLVDFSAA